jgi:hypothetical protein
MTIYSFNFGKHQPTLVMLTKPVTKGTNRVPLQSLISRVQNVVEATLLNNYKLFNQGINTMLEQQEYQEVLSLFPAIRGHLVVK